MPRNEVYKKIEDCRSALFLDGGRFVDMGMQLRVYRRSKSGKAEKGDLFPTIYGGTYDRLLRRYVAPPSKIQEFACTEAQLAFITSTSPGIIREMLLGAPGAGKTFGLCLRAIRRALERPNSTFGCVGATGDRRLILWNRILSWLNPLGWLEDVKVNSKEIRLKNGVIFQVLAATAPSKQAGSPIQGRDWTEAYVDEHQSIVKESHQEIDSRGRRAGTAYKVSSTATNQRHIPEFRIELERFKNQDNHRLHRVAGFTNPFVDPKFYEALRTRYSERDYKAIILAEDVPPESLVYHQFQFDRTIRPLPSTFNDITARVTQEILGKPYDYVVGQDFGVLTDAAEVIKIIQDPVSGQPCYWVIDEITSIRTHTEVHARKILTKYPKDRTIVIGDPHLNTRDADKSDYKLFRKEGLQIIRAREGNIAVEERVSMMNRMLFDADGKSHLFISTDEHGEPVAPKLVEAMLTQERNPYGKIDNRKDLKHDFSHWPDAVSFGLYRFCRTRAKIEDQVRTTLYGIT